MNKIEKEFKKSQDYYLKCYEDSELIELSTDNVAKVEAMIHFNSSYGMKFAQNCKDLAPVLKGETKLSKEAYRKLLEETIIAIDSENSTHLNSDGAGREEITERLLAVPKNDLIKYLEDPVGTDYKLLKLIAKETTAKGESKNGNARKNRTNLSFASKFCHYLCFYVFEGKKEQDNYSIYDKVIRKTLPLYTEYYGIEVKKKDLKDYEYYQNVIDTVIKKSNSGISRNGFDHLIWYSYKG